MKGVLLIALATLLTINATAQRSSTELEQMNTLTDYSNQNIHGLFIIHRLLELYNQDINQYVDLEGYQLNAFGNDDLPKDIFEDPKKEFYKTETPRSIYNRLNPGINSQLKPYLHDFHLITKEANKLRWDIADFMVHADFSKGENIGTVYEMLEKCVSLFDNYNSHRISYVNYIQSQVSKPAAEHASFIASANRIYNITNDILGQLRAKDNQDISGQISNLKSELTKLENASFPFTRNKSNIESFQRLIGRGKEFIEWAEAYHEGKPIPTENKQYGKFYYYHNYKLLHRVNYSGVGMFYEFNELFRNNQVNTYLLPEIPHFFKVIYPVRKTKIELVESGDTEKVVELSNAKLIHELPTELNGREVVVNKIQIDPSSGNELVFELYDSMLLDGDIISINFNGDWVLENHSLESEPLKLIVNANPAGKNYFIVHAVNVGSKPPNTIAVKYRPKKRKKEILLACDENTSQLIEINFSKIK